MEPFIGMIVMFGGNFAPRSWAFCDGQLLPIASNTALFSILGTIYGGDGRTTFGLPDLRGRSPMHEGNGPGLNARNLGAKGGDQTRVLTTPNLPAHSHTATGHAYSGQANQRGPSGHVPAMEPANVTGLYSDQTPDVNLSAGAITVANTGSNQGFGIEHPYQVVNFIIALQGIFPSRS